MFKRIQQGTYFPRDSFLITFNPIAEKTSGITFLMNQSILNISLEKYCTRYKRIDALGSMLKPCSFYGNEFIF